MSALLAHDDTEERFRAIFGGRRGRPKYPMDRARGDDHDIFTKRVRLGWCDLYWRDTDHPERPFLWVLRDGKIIYTSMHKDWQGDSESQICLLGGVLSGTEYDAPTYGREYSSYHEPSQCSIRFSTRGHHLRLLAPDEGSLFLWRPRASVPGEDGARLAWKTITESLCAAQRD